MESWNFAIGRIFFTYLALAIDATASELKLEEKLRRIRSNIDRGFLTEVRYFHSENLDLTGRKDNIPRVVVGADHKTLQSLMESWVEGRYRDLADHHMQLQMIYEILAQLDAFKAYAEKKNKTKLAKIYQTDLNLMEDVLSEKRKHFGSARISHMEREIKQDRIYAKLANLVENFGK